MTEMWSATEYLKFRDERARPFRDLLAQVPQHDFKHVVDLGCGPGTMTKLLAERWPQARVVGVDSSPQMLDQAKAWTLPGRLDFELADIATWKPATPLDCMISNAALQWVNNHEHVLPHLAAMIAPGGTLAVQMPNRFQTPTQIAIEETVADPRWHSLLKGVGLRRDSVHPLDWYIHHLHDLGFAVNAWETNYYHVLTGENPVLDWLSGTALRPLLALLPEPLATEFREAIAARLKRVYPARHGVTLFPMPRLFFLATRS